MRDNDHSVRASVTSSASIQIIASASGSRFRLKDFFITCRNGSTTSTLTLKEVGNSVSANLFSEIADASGRVLLSHAFAEGYKASDTGTALKMVWTVEGTAQGLFTYTYDG